MTATARVKLIEEVPSLYRIIAFNVLRRTPGVDFHTVPVEAFAHIDALDHVLHAGGAFSPGSVGPVQRPWYMHPHQDDNLVVFHGTRYIDLYTKKHGRVESFVVTPDRIDKAGTTLYEGPAMLIWTHCVFHRIQSDQKLGSASLNFAVRYPDFDIRTNFNIYDLDTQTGEHRVIREGYLDQPGDV